MPDKLLAVFLKVRNGILRNDLYNCLLNIQEYASEIFVCDDASYDGTTQVLESLLPEENILKVPLEEHSFAKELFHKEELLKLIHKKGPFSFILWMDSDEILDAKGTEGIREFCRQNLTTQVQGWAFHYSQCLHENSSIYTEEGSKTIKDIVKNKYKGKVLSVNTNNFFEYKNIIGWYTSKKLDRKFIKVYFVDSHIDTMNRKKGVIVTEDHKFLTKRGYVQAKDLREDDLVASKSKYTNDPRFYQIMYGSLLGDGCIRKDNSFQEYHCLEQEEYLLLKSKILSNLNLCLFNSEQNNKGFHNRGFHFTLDCLKDLRKSWYPEGKRVYPKGIVKKLNALGLAIWYMDNGTLSKITPNKSSYVSSKDNIKKYYDRKDSSKPFYYNVKIACGNISEESVDDLIKDLKEIGFPFYKMKKKIKGYSSVYWDLVLSKEEHYNRFFEYIIQYVPQSMRYKVTDNYKNYPFYEEAYTPIIPEVLYKNVKIEYLPEKYPISNSQNSLVYCIDVEDNHNFVTPGGVVHNCWINTQYARTDDGFDDGWFIKLWRYRSDLTFIVEEGTHKIQFPKQILEAYNNHAIQPAPFEIIHYGNVGQGLKYKAIQYRNGLGGVDRHLRFDEKATYRKIPQELFPYNALKIEGDVPKPFTAEQVRLTDMLFDMNKLQKHFCVIIPTYNRHDTLSRAFDSLIAQTYEKWHCVVLDDGCLSGNTYIQTSSGLKKLKNIKKGDLVSSLNEDSFNINLLSRTLHKDLTLNFNKVKKLIPKGIKNVFIIKTNNNEIKATDNHPFLVIRKDKIIYNKNKENCPSCNEEKIYKLKDHVNHRQCSNRYCKKSWYVNKIRNDYYLEWIPVRDLKIGDKIICNSKQLQSNDFHNDLVPLKLSYKKLKINSKVSKNIKLPEYTTEDFMRIVGFFVGDGCIQKNIHGDPFSIILCEPKTGKFSDKYVNLIKKVFGLSSHYYKSHENQFHIYSKQIAELFQNLDLDHKACDKYVPDWVFSLPLSQQKAFVEGYADADGYRMKDVYGKRSLNSKGNIKFQCCSEKLMYSLKNLCNNLGYYTSKIIYKKLENKWKSIRNTGKDYVNTYSFNLIEKKSKTINNIYGTFYRGEKGRKNNFGFFNEFINIQEIKSIDVSGEEEVFDLEVENNHNFIANGIVVHNSTSPETEKVVMEYCNKDPRFFYCKYLEHRGGVAVNENGMDIAINTADWWVRLGSDDWFFPNKLELDAKAFNEGHMALYSLFTVHRNGVFGESGNYPLPSDKIKEGFTRGGFYASWASVAVSTQVLQQIKEKYGNYVDPRLIHMEDFLFNYRVSTLCDWVFVGQTKEGEVIIDPSENTMKDIMDKKIIIEPCGVWNVNPVGASSDGITTNTDQQLTLRLIAEEEFKYERK